MNDLPGKREDARPIEPQEVQKGLIVWVQLNKKGARVAATVSDHSVDKSRCTVTLEIDDPTNPGQVIRQAYTRPVQVYQLTRREGPAKSAPQTSPEPEATTPAPEIHAEDQAQDLASLTYYSRETLHYQGPHDQARRAYLRGGLCPWPARAVPYRCNHARRDQARHGRQASAAHHDKIRKRVFPQN